MQFDHVHFYVDNAQFSQDLFIRKLGFQRLGCIKNSHTQTEVVNQGSIYFLISSPLSGSSPVADYLHHHPPGVVDVAFQVDDLELQVEKIVSKGGKILQPIQDYCCDQGLLKWATIAGWGGLRHTLVQEKRNSNLKLLPDFFFPIPQVYLPTKITEIDHVVFNVEVGDLIPAVNWYKNLFELKPQQTFNIRTKRSGLHSQVLVSDRGNVKFPINEPTSETSQIQEFLEANQGSGIQHIALRTQNIIQTVAQLRQQGLPFLSVPDLYYKQLKQKWSQNNREIDWESLQKYQVLADYSDATPEAMLLQIFTQPIFEQPTIFFELIERKICWIQDKKVQAQGFGEGNFQALFEAIEREQVQRSRETETKVQPN